MLYCCCCRSRNMWSSWQGFRMEPRNLSALNIFVSLVQFEVRRNSRHLPVTLSILILHTAFAGSQAWGPYSWCWYSIQGFFLQNISSDSWKSTQLGTAPHTMLLKSFFLDVYCCGRSRKDWLGWIWMLGAFLHAQTYFSIEWKSAQLYIWLFSSCSL